jgi:ubiquinone/menaquinone biosynthesis C-methylase UbiE
MQEPIDTSKLDPATLAQHLGHPQGEIGRAVTASLNKANAGAYTAALHKLDLHAGQHIVEIGFGNGREIPRVLALASNLSYLGIDISETMVADAEAFNADAMRAGQVRLVLGSSSAIPAEDHAFDKALALNTLYFWPQPLEDLQELRRVLRPGGRLVLGALAPHSAATLAVFQHGFRLYEQPEIKALLAGAGFAKVTIDTVNETITPPTGQPWNRDYFIVAAE